MSDRSDGGWGIRWKCEFLVFMVRWMMGCYWGEEIKRNKGEKCFLVNIVTFVTRTKSKD